MPTLPTTTYAFASSATEAQFKTFLTGQREFLAGLIGTTGDQSSALMTLGAPMNGSSTKSGAYTVVGSDRGKVLKCSGTWTLSLTAAATLGDGFVFEVVNEGAGIVTIDANLSETINGATTKTIPAGGSCFVFCDGAKFITIGASSAADIAAALGYTPGKNGTTFSWVLVGKFNPSAVNVYATYGTGLYSASFICFAIHPAQTTGHDSGASVNVYKLSKD